MQLQAETPEALPERVSETTSVRLVLESHHEARSPGEFHPRALIEPDVKLSLHPAPALKPHGGAPNFQCANRAGSRCATLANQRMDRCSRFRRRLNFRALRTL